MTTPEPTAEHVDAVARLVHAESWSWLNPHNAAHIAKALLATDDPDALAALAANLPREVMLAALVADGTLTEDHPGMFTWRRFVSARERKP